MEIEKNGAKSEERRKNESFFSYCLFAPLFLLPCLLLLTRLGVSRGGRKKNSKKLEKKIKNFKNAKTSYFSRISARTWLKVPTIMKSTIFALTPGLCFLFRGNIRCNKGIIPWNCSKINCLDYWNYCGFFLKKISPLPPPHCLNLKEYCTMCTLGWSVEIYFDQKEQVN